jgi:type VI secretion system secreted protein VgrG
MATRRPIREPASVSDDRRTTVRGKLAHHVGGSARDTVGGDRTTEIGGSDALSVGRDRATSIGKDDRLNVAKKLLIEAGDEVTIKCGAASMTLKKDGTVAIKGKDIMIEAAGNATLKAGKDIVLKGQKIVDD